jgi:hypothetical protein
LRDIPEDEWFSVGFSQKDADKLLKTLNGKPLEVHELEVGTIHDTFWINVRGPLQDQAVVLTKMKSLLAEYPAVEIDIGLTEQP